MAVNGKHLVGRGMTQTTLDVQRFVNAPSAERKPLHPRKILIDTFRKDN
jgi:hypothetical protein